MRQPCASDKFITPLDGPYIQYLTKKMLDFSSSDFLGLAQHPDVKKSVIKYVLRLGIGAHPSFVGCAVQKQLEERLACVLERESARLFSTYAEAKRALQEMAEVVEGNLESLKKSKVKGKIVYVPADQVDVEALVKFAKEQKAMLCIDDSYTFGLTGKRGFGSATDGAGLKTDIVIGSLHNGGGSPAAYIAASGLKIGCAESLSPAVLGALDAAFNLIPDMNPERAQVQQNVVWLHHKLQEKGFAPFTTRYPTTTLSFSSAEEAEKLWQRLAVSNIFVGTMGGRELSLTMTALHTPDDLDQLANALTQLSATDFALATQSLTPTP